MPLEHWLWQYKINNLEEASQHVYIKYIFSFRFSLSVSDKASDRDGKKGRTFDGIRNFRV